MAGNPHDLNLVAAFVEDRLDDTERQQLVAHLAGCAECRATLAAYARAAGPGQPAQAAATLTPSSWRRWMPIAATLALATIGGVVALVNRDSSALPPTVDTNPPTAQPPAAESPRTSPAPPPSGPGRGPASAPSTPASPSANPTLRRGSDHIVGGKTFALVAGDWIDRSYDRLALLPVVDVRTASERDTLLARIPALKPFAAIGPRVLVVHEGTVYRFGPVEHR
jgi:anti-sigma factor RsiW